MDGRRKKNQSMQRKKNRKRGCSFFSFPFFFLGGCKRLRVQQCAASLFVVVSSTELGWKGGNGSVLGSCYISQRGLFGRNAKQKSNRGNGGVRMA